MTRFALLLYLLLAVPALADGPFPVARIVDGDTIVVLTPRKTSVRLIGVDTPETVHPRKPVERFGREASAFTKKLLVGESVRLEYGQQKADRYGRKLAYVYRARDGLFVNREIIAQGYGFYYGKYAFARMEEFRGAEREARENRRGLWGN